MHSDRFEHAFSEYLDSKRCDEAESAVFSIIRSAFFAGWKAAGGEAAEPHGNWTDLLHKSQSQN